MTYPRTQSMIQFEAVADVLIATGASDRTKTTTLAGFMDSEGVPMLSAQRYWDDPAITALFASRGVRRATPAEMRGDQS